MEEGGEQKDREIKNAPIILKSNIWAHFGFYEHIGKRELDKTHAVCKACHTKIKYLGNTTNLRNHVSRFHSDLLKPASAKETPDPGPSQPKIDAILSTLLPNSEKGKKITKAVAAFIAKDLRPYSVVDNLGFRHLMKTLEPRYKLSSRNHFTENVIPALYNETKAQVIASMSQASRVAITCDAWTSVTTDSYITFTAHYISKDWQILSHVLQTRAVYESHTGEKLAELLSRVVEEWQLSDKSVVLLGRVRRIATFFHRSTIAIHCLKEKQKCRGLKNHKLITDVTTRWNSSYDMVERFLQQQHAICDVLILDVSRSQKKRIRSLMLPQMSEERNPTVSLIAPLHAQLIQNMTDAMGDTTMIHEIKNAIKTDLLKRYNIEAEKKILYTASAMDPRFKGLPFILTEEEGLEIYRGVTEEAASLEDSPAPPKKKTSSLLMSLLGQSFSDNEGTIEPKTPYAKAEEEMKRYCKEPSLPLTEDPLKWWCVHEAIFPLLSQLVSAERVFSTAGDVLTAKRSSLKPERGSTSVLTEKPTYSQMLNCDSCAFERMDVFFHGIRDSGHTMRIFVRDFVRIIKTLFVSGRYVGQTLAAHSVRQY
uniref:BED-type domain-containing protein n=1 Tax=Leptobrachium leishanense TaxID=445787 RepID=A0A8C5R241_9ANUR